MKFFLLILSVLVGLSSLADDSWYQCKLDSDCIHLKGGCGVEWAVNKNFKLRSKLYPPREISACTKPAEFHPDNSVAKCEKDKCVLDPKGMFAGGTPIP